MNQELASPAGAAATEAHGWLEKGVTLCLVEEDKERYYVSSRLKRLQQEIYDVTTLVYHGSVIAKGSFPKMTTKV